MGYKVCSSLQVVLLPFPVVEGAMKTLVFSSVSELITIIICKLLHLGIQLGR